MLLLKQHKQTGRTKVKHPNKSFWLFHHFISSMMNMVVWSTTDHLHTEKSISGSIWALCCDIAGEYIFLVIIIDSTTEKKHFSWLSDRSRNSQMQWMNGYVTRSTHKSFFCFCSIPWWWPRFIINYDFWCDIFMLLFVTQNRV